MEKLEIIGGKKISGTIVISGSKNSTLPILASTILANKKVVIKGRVFLRSVNFQIHKGLFQFFGKEETKKKAKKRQIPDSNKSQYCSKI